tara:strand:- start:313 stop:486 length:174 start_codon:yes stop_codon:yes gene_type:complete
MVLYTVVDDTGLVVKTVGSYKEAREMAKQYEGDVLKDEYPCTKEGMLQVANYFVAIS